MKSNGHLTAYNSSSSYAHSWLARRRSSNQCGEAVVVLSLHVPAPDAGKAGFRKRQSSGSYLISIASKSRLDLENFPLSWRMRQNMAQQKVGAEGGGQKRKFQSDGKSRGARGTDASNKKQKTAPNHQHFRQKQRDARVLSTQTASDAFKNGALDVEKFVSAREFEIRALEEGMQRSGKALNRRAFQQVPRELRRRTAAHDVRRIPKRLKERGRREMKEDNTPGPGGVGKRLKKVSRRTRLREETIKKLRGLGAKKKAEKDNIEKQQVKVLDFAKDTTSKAPETSSSMKPVRLQPRNPKIKKDATLAIPPKPKAKFRKRQRNKSWLPTHLFHAKRAHITPPSAPLWRFAIPLTPTQKSYRPTHRASRDRGAVAWDMSYMSTIQMTGAEGSLKTVLRGLGVGVQAEGGDEWIWGSKGERWREGRRILQSTAFERETGKSISPITVIWCINGVTTERTKRQMFIRVHPSAFHQLWEEVTRLAKVAKPTVTVNDLRFEIGSIEVAGPGATEALLGTLWPDKRTTQRDSTADDQSTDVLSRTWSSLAGLTNTSSLPAGALLNLNIQDPRLHHPPKTVALPKTYDDQKTLLSLLSSWPPDETKLLPSSLFDSRTRTRNPRFPSQKAINRRKRLAAPGAYPSPLPTDPSVPVILFPSTSCTTNGWTLLASWKAIKAIWYTLIYYPLSTGSQPRLGGVREQHQLSFESGRPWFPGDAPGTKAGWEWEMSERAKRLDEWKRRPKGKRTAWEKVAGNADGKGGRGEVGEGWSCGWETLLETAHASDDENTAPTTITEDTSKPDTQAGGKVKNSNELLPSTPTAFPKPLALVQLTRNQAVTLIQSSPSSPVAPDLLGKLVTVQITLLTRGVPETCARIYRLPSATSQHAALRHEWLQLAPERGQHVSIKKRQTTLPSKLPPPATAEDLQRRLAQELIRGDNPADRKKMHPACPPQEDLIGFVTTGNFNLAEGRGTGIGSLTVWNVLQHRSGSPKEQRLCVVRNAGEDVARLARWDLV